MLLSRFHCVSLIETEQKMKAHKKSLSQGQDMDHDKLAHTSGGDGLSGKVSAKSRHNKRQLELYKKRQKARKAQLA